MDYLIFDGLALGDVLGGAMIAEFNSRSRDLVIDFEHSTLTGGKARRR